MPKIAAPPKADTTTATGQAVNRARTIARRAGRVPAPDVEPKGNGIDEFKADTTSNPAPAEPVVEESEEPKEEAAEAAPPAKKATARKRATAKPAATPKATPASDSWFAPLDETTDYLNILWYGPEGSTKTTSLATVANLAPEGSKVLIINAEGGMKVMALRKHGVKTNNIKVFPDPRSDDVLNDESLERVFLRVQADLIEDPNSWFAVGIDSLTEVGQLLVDEAQSLRVERLRKNTVAQVPIDKNFVDRDDYGVSVKIMRRWLRRFRDLPCHFLVTALERRDIDEDTNKVRYGPAVSPALANDLMGYVDIAIATKPANESTGAPIRGLTKASGRYRAKDRFDVLPTTLVYPTFDRIHEYFTGETTVESDPHQESLPAAKKPKEDDSMEDTK